MTAIATPVPTTGAEVSATALLRAAGLPIAAWTAAGAPELFAALRAHADECAALGDAAAAVADRIGAELVPDPELPTPRRRQALAVRRALHRVSRGDLPPTRDLDALRAVAAFGGHGLRADLVALADRLAAAAAADDDLGRAVLAEHERLLPAARAALTSSLAGRMALADGTLDAAADVPARLAAGEPWTSKRMRRRSEYLWRMVARGATKTTPRGWLGHVALLEVVASHGAPPVLTAEAAVQRMGSVHAARQEPAGDTDEPGRRWWFEPLHRMDGEHLQFWTVDGGVASEVRLRATAPLLALRAALRDGARDAEHLAAAVLPPGAGDAERAALRVLLARLTELGVLRTARHAPRELTPLTPAAAVGTPVTTAPRTAEYVDVHRRATGGVPRAAATGWGDDVLQVLRLQHLMQTGAAAPCSADARPKERWVLDVLAARIAAMGRAGKPDARTVAPSHWPAPTDPASGYATLVARLADGATALDEAALDAAGAPPAGAVDEGWPLDCILRPLSDGGAVLESVQPAGVYDARFADALADLHGTTAHTADYAAFLRRLDARTGVESVELLAPPLVPGSANAVRRPLYTTAWTGDPDLLGHCRGGDARHLPLDELVLRVENGIRTLLHRDRPIRPVYHATRYPVAPWDTVYRTLMSASPQQRCRVRRLRHALGALPGAARLSRITVGRLVVAPAQWRLPVAAVDDLRRGGLAAVRALDRLRAARDLPRFTFVSAGLGGKPLACDWESVRSVALLLDAADRAKDGELVVEEMLPAPDGLTVHDLLDGIPSPVAGELLVRFGAATPLTWAHAARTTEHPTNGRTRYP